MLKKFQKTLSFGLTGLLALGIGTADAADVPAKRTPNVLHEMVPHVVLPETIQYNKTAKLLPGVGNVGVTSPYAATYVAYPSYQVPYAAVFRPIGQSVYPVSPPLLPAPLPKEQPELDPAVEENLAALDLEGRDVVLNNKIAEPIQLASGAEEVIPMLPVPNGAIMQTGIFCQHPTPPPSAWAFSSPLFKVASVPSGWGNNTGSITHNSPKGSGQHIGFTPGNGAASDEAGVMQQGGVPYSTFSLGRMNGMDQNAGAQAQVLPNGMILLTMPSNHSNCGILRCRCNGPKTYLLPAAGNGLPQQGMTQGMMMPGSPMQNAMMQNAVMSGNFGMPYMQAAQQPQMMPQMQLIPATAMTPMGPAVVGYQQVPMMNPMMMNPMMGQMMNNPMAMMNPQPQQIQMAMAQANPMVAAQVSGTETNEDNTLQAPGLIGGVASETATPMALVATPYGYAIQVSAEALQADAASQLAQMQQSLLQSQMAMPMQTPSNPYAGLYATPFGYMALNQSAGHFGSLGQSAMMNVGYQPMGMMMPGQGGMSMSEMLQIMAFINSSKPQRRTRMFERIAERREARRAACNNDPMMQLMEAWSTPYAAPDTTVRMPSSNAYPYGYFGAQGMPMSTANYGGYHNLYMGNTAYPGLY